MSNNKLRSWSVASIAVVLVGGCDLHPPPENFPRLDFTDATLTCARITKAYAVENNWLLQHPAPDSIRSLTLPGTLIGAMVDLPRIHANALDKANWQAHHDYWWDLFTHGTEKGCQKELVDVTKS